MVLGVTKHYYSISYSVSVLKYFNLSGFGTLKPLVDKVHHASFKLFQLKKVPIQAE